MDFEKIHVHVSEIDPLVRDFHPTTVFFLSYLTFLQIRLPIVIQTPPIARYV